MRRRFPSDFFAVKQFVNRSIEKVLLKRLSFHVLHPFFEVKAHGLSFLPVKKRVGVFPRIFVNQISFSKGATDQRLYRVNATGVVFNDTDQLFIKRRADPHLFHNSLTDFYADSKARTGMPMESTSFVPKVEIHSFS
jgi:hypothetical protein